MLLFRLPLESICTSKANTPVKTRTLFATEKPRFVCNRLPGSVGVSARFFSLIPALLLSSSALRGHFKPVIEIPLMNCFWNRTKTIAEGIMISAAAAMVAERFVECCVEK